MSGLPVVPIVLFAAALIGVAYALLAPGAQRLPVTRRRPSTEAAPTSALSEATNTATGLIDRILQRRGDRRAVAALLQRAGVRQRPQDVILIILAATLLAGALGVVLGSGWLGVLLAALVPVGVRLWLTVLTGRRRHAFADQLDDSLQLMAGALRAGHSLPQALASVAREADEPTGEEFARIINETRVGRELGDALSDTAVRMDNQDFVWVSQAIAINREVGGNLAEVLDGVGVTIRERNQIRRQVKALAAEGKLSAGVLVVMPVAIIGFLAVANPEYLSGFTDSALGYLLIAISVLLMAVGTFWLSRVVRVAF